MLPEENKALVRRYLKEVVSDGNVDRANEFVAADLVFTSPYTPEPTRNSEDFKRMINTLHAVFPDMRLTEEATLCEGDLVALEALEERDVSKVAGLLSDDFAFVNPVEPMDREDFVRFMEGLLAGFPDYRFNHGDARVNGDVVTVKLRMTGTHTRTLTLPMPGLKPVPATGKKVVLPEQRFAYTVRNARITTITPEPMPHAGIIGLLEQIGIRLPPLWVMKLVARAGKLSKRIAGGPRTALPRAAEHKP